MPLERHREEPNAIQTNLGAIFVSLELSRSTWLITSLSPGGGTKMSKHAMRGGNVAVLLERFAQLREKARTRTGEVFPFIVIQEAGLDGFWIHRVLQAEGIESHVVDPASIATSRRRRRAKTGKIDGEALIRDGVINRSPMREIPHSPVALYEVAHLFGTLIAETILASVHVRAHKQAGHIAVHIRSTRSSACRSDSLGTSQPSRPLMDRSSTKSPITKASISVRKKHSSASSGRQTTGSFSLNEVLSTIGTPVRSRKHSMRR
jgi:hypothetical protein